MTLSYQGGLPSRAARALPVLGFGGAVVLIGLGLTVALPMWQKRPTLVPPPTVTIPAGEISFRPGGDFRIGTRVVDAPLRQVTTPGFAILQFPVSQADYALCVAAGACRAADAKGQSADLAVTGVSFVDASAYANWFSQATGQSWRLPTDAEWQHAAAERALSEDLGQSSDDPALRWLLSYRAEVAARDAADPLVHPRGYFGQNSLGIGDLAGNIWEWTSSCFENTRLSADGTVLDSSDYCGVRAVEGQHRTFVVDFIRDPQSGGCSVGFPPDFAGFRLVRD